MRKEAIAGLALIVVVLALCYAAVAVSDFMACKFRWAAFAETRWGVMSGCQLKLQDGRWVPADAVREIPL